MFFVKILFLLLFHAAFSNNLWHVYVDVELSEVTKMQHSMTNMISAIIQTDEVKISCPHMIRQTSQDDTAVAKTITFPCAFLDSVMPITADAQPDHVWTITCPKVLWIELTIALLELPLSGIECADGYVAFLNLLGEPPDVTYCGRKPQDILYSATKLTVIQHIQRLQFELRMNLKYQFITKLSQRFHQRMPYILSGYKKLKDVKSETEISRILLMEIPYHSVIMTHNPDIVTDIVQYKILCMPNQTQEHLLRLVVHAGECNYVVHDGPGILSPSIGNSSTHGMIYLVETPEPIYIELWGATELCHPVKIEYQVVATLGTFYSDIIPNDEINEPINCLNSSYLLINAYAEFVVESSVEHNVWCRISVQLDYPLHWKFWLDIEFYGPNNLYRDTTGSSCQFGGVYSIEYEGRRSRAFCESLLLHDNHYTRFIRRKYIRFYAGYSSGRVKLKIFKADVAPMSFNWDGLCDESTCAGNNIHIWNEESLALHPDGSVHKKDKHLFFDTYPKQYSYWITEPVIVNKIHVHITAGKEDGSLMLGLVHFLLSLQCSERSICTTKCIIGSSLLASNFTKNIYFHEGSVVMNKHIGYARMISVNVNVSDAEKVQLKIFFENVHHCDHSAPGQYAEQLSYDNCDLIRIKNSLSYAHFITQIMQGLTIGLDPACPMTKCFDMNVKVTPLCRCSSSYEWKKTALEHTPIIVNYGYAITSLQWTQSAQCSADFQVAQHLCDVWIKVNVSSFAEFGVYSKVKHQYDHLTVPLLSNTDQLYAYKT